MTALALFPAGCRRPGPVVPSTRAVTQPSGHATAYSNPRFGVGLTYPAQWTTRPSNNFVLLLVPAGASQTPDVSISLDIPDLPPHFPGLIPIGAVKNGYLEDLRKQVGQLDTQELTPPSIPDANARLLRSTWQTAGRTMSQTTLLMTHDDRVYILRATADSAHREQTESALDKIIHSLTWKPRDEK